MKKRQIAIMKYMIENQDSINDVTWEDLYTICLKQKNCFTCPLFLNCELKFELKK